jgi:hypothetical protein
MGEAFMTEFMTEFKKQIQEEVFRSGISGSIPYEDVSVDSPDAGSGNQVSVSEVYHMLFRTVATLTVPQSEQSGDIIISPATIGQIGEALRLGCELVPKLYHHRALPDRFKQDFFTQTGEAMFRRFQASTFTPEQYAWLILNQVDVFNLAGSGQGVYYSHEAHNMRDLLDQTDLMGTTRIQHTLYYAGMYRELLVRVDYSGTRSDTGLMECQILIWNPDTACSIGSKIVILPDEDCLFRPVLRSINSLDDQERDELWSLWMRWDDEQSMDDLYITDLNKRMMHPKVFLWLLDHQVDLFGLLLRDMAVSPLTAELKERF